MVKATLNGKEINTNYCEILTSDTTFKVFPFPIATTAELINGSCEPFSEYFRAKGNFFSDNFIILQVTKDAVDVFCSKATLSEILKYDKLILENFDENIWYLCYYNAGNVEKITTTESKTKPDLKYTTREITENMTTESFVPVFIYNPFKQTWKFVIIKNYYAHYEIISHVYIAWLCKNLRIVNKEIKKEGIEKFYEVFFRIKYPKIEYKSYYKYTIRDSFLTSKNFSYIFDEGVVKQPLINFLKQKNIKQFFESVLDNNSIEKIKEVEEDDEKKENKQFIYRETVRLKPIRQYVSFDSFVKKESLTQPTVTCKFFSVPLKLINTGIGKILFDVEEKAFIFEIFSVEPETAYNTIIAEYPLLKYYKIYIADLVI